MKNTRWFRGMTVGILSGLLLMFVLGGCASNKSTSSDASKKMEETNAQIAVLDIKIGMTEQNLIKTLGETTKDNCVYGYEMNYEEKQLSIGVNTEGKVRRIKTANPDTSICMVKPGMPLEEAIKAVLKAGYAQVPDTKKFEKEGIRVELLSKENKLADQISIEIIEK